MSKKKTPRSAAENEAMAFAAAIRSSTRKLNLVAESIRGLKADEALAQLTFSPRRVAGEVKKVLQSAIANAENNHELDVDRLEVSRATVGRGLVMKRMHTRARGRGSRIVKEFSNLTVIVRERPEATAAAEAEE